MLTERLFRLMERHQKLDALLNRAQRRHGADPFEIMRLQKLRLAIKARLTSAIRPALATA